MSYFYKIFVLLTFCVISKISIGNQDLRNDSINNARRIFSVALDLADQGFYKESTDSFKISLIYFKKLYGEKNFYAGRIQSNLGINYKNIGQYDKSLQFYNLAEESYLSDSLTILRDFIDLVRLYTNIGIVFRSKLNYPTALEYYKKAVNTLKNQSKINYQDIADVYYNIANVYIQTGKFDEALEVISEYQPLAYPDAQIDFLDLQAAIYQLLNEYNKAEESYEKAIESAINLTSENDLLVAQEYLNYASLLITIGKMEKAADILNKAYEIIIETQPNEGIDLASYYINMGDYNVNRNVESKEMARFKQQKSYYLNEAIKYYDKGLEALNFGFNINSDSVPDLNNSLNRIQSLVLLKLIADTYVELALIYDDTRKNNYTKALTDALDYYEVTAKMIQVARKEMVDEEDKIQLTGLQQETFQKMIKTAYKAYQVNGNLDIINFAFKNAEQIKASSIFDQLSDELAKNSLVPDSLIELEKTLNYSITQNNESRYYLAREESPDSTAINRIDSILFQLKRERDDLNRYMEDNYSEFYDLKYSNDLLGIKDVQEKLKKDEVLIEFSLDETDSIPELYTIVVSKNDIRFINPEIDSTFIIAIENVFRFMSNPRYMFTKNEDSKRFCIESNRLYNKLILPIKNEIREKKIFIVPDGKLSYISFDGLVEALPDTTSTINFSSLKYLIKSNSIQYTYSANLLFKFEKQRRIAKERLIAFAPEYDWDTITFDNQQLALTPLPGTQKEVDLISNQIKSKLYTVENATEINFRENSENFDILHLAMHAFIDDEQPAFSRLAFTQNKNETIENDGWLNTADIYNLHLKARLTVLSACNTGSGQLRKGEGVMSLARGFLYAGCPSIIMTLWEVEDKAGTDIMTSFYKNLKRGRTTDSALRLAKLDYLENANPRTAHPHYWLGYVSIGNNTPLFRSYDYYFFGLLILALAAIIIDQVVRSKKSNRTESE